MHPRIFPLSVLALALGGCPPLPPGLMTCEEADACSTSEPPSTTGDGAPTTSDGVQTVTGDNEDADSSSTTPADETGTTTDQPALPPQIVDGVVIPDYIDENGLLDVEVTTKNADGVTMLLESGALTELTPTAPGKFAGQIAAFTALDNGKRKAVLTPFRDMLVGDSVEADYVIALPPLAYEIGWQTEDMSGSVAAIAVLPDGRPVELGTYTEMGAPRCYLNLRDKHGKSIEFVPLLASSYCRAIDLQIDRDTGRMHMLVERKLNDETVWWAGEISAWGKGPKNIGIGDVGDTAFALAARPDVVAVCGSRAVATPDELDALAVLLRPGEDADPRVFDYRPGNDPQKKHEFTETARDCAFSSSGDTLVLAGEANGRHDGDNFPTFRDRLMLIEADVAGDDPAWTVAGLDQGFQTRALALDVDDQGRYLLAGYTCFDACEPVGEVRFYAPGGKLVAPTSSLGPLGSAWFGPHDIAWSSAGYAVVALGELQGQSFVFKVQAVAPGVALPLWTFLPNTKQGLQLALAVAAGPYGEVYAGGIAAGDHPAFARIGG